MLICYWPWIRRQSSTFSSTSLSSEYLLRVADNCFQKHIPFKLWYLDGILQQVHIFECDFPQKYWLSCNPPLLFKLLEIVGLLDWCFKKWFFEHLDEKWIFTSIFYRVASFAKLRSVSVLHYREQVLCNWAFYKCRQLAIEDFLWK